MKVLSAVAAATGSLLIGWSVLLYESEERAISDRIAAWWVKLDDASKLAVTRNQTIIEAVAAAIVRWLDDIFGERLWSFRAVAISTCLSFSSAAALMAHGILAETPVTPWDVKVAMVWLLLSSALFFAAVAKRPRYLWAIVFIIAIAAVVVANISMLVKGATLGKLLAIPVGLVLGIACDFLVLLLIRRVASTTAALTTPVKIVFFTAGSLLLGTALLCIPALVVYGHDDFRGWWGNVALIAALTNLYAGTISFVFVPLTLVLLLQRAFWQLLTRPIYAIQRFQLLQKRGAVFYAGTVLIAFGFPSIASVLLNAINVVAR